MEFWAKYYTYWTVCVCFTFYSKPQRILSHSLQYATQTLRRASYFKLLTPLISDYDSLLSSHHCCTHTVCLACCLSHFHREGPRETDSPRERERGRERAQKNCRDNRFLCLCVYPNFCSIVVLHCCMQKSSFSPVMCVAFDLMPSIVFFLLFPFVCYGRDFGQCV